MKRRVVLEVLVWIFVRTDCPISNRYAPEIQRLYHEFSTRGVAFSLIYPASDETAARTHAKQYALPGNILFDRQHRLVKMSDVHITPEAAVFSPANHLVYHGRIDDRYVSFGQARSNPTTHDLEAAIQAVLNGKPVPKASGPAIGCAIE